MLGANIIVRAGGDGFFLSGDESRGRGPVRNVTSTNNFENTQSTVPIKRGIFFCQPFPTLRQSFRWTGVLPTMFY